MSKTKFSEKNLETLDKLYKVTNEIYFQSDVINIANSEGNFMAYYKWDKSIPDEFGMSNCNIFTKIIKEYKDVEIDISDVKVTIEGKKSKSVFPITDKECIEVPPSIEDLKERLGVDADNTFELKKEEVESIVTHYKLLGCPTVKFSDKSVSLIGANNTSSSSYHLDLDIQEDLEEKLFESKFFTEIDLDDYTVELFPDQVFLIGKNNNLAYCIACFDGV